MSEYKFLNPGNRAFSELRDSEFFVDKTGMIEKLNDSCQRRNKYFCISRPRGFGKTSDAEMIAAYYDRTVDSKELFEGLDISKSESFDKFINKYNVLYISVSDYYKSCDKKASTWDIVCKLFKDIASELNSAFPEVKTCDEDMLSYALSNIAETSGVRFVIIVDDFDTLFFERKDDEDDLRAYLSAFNSIIKDNWYVEIAYMTGILAVKNYFLSTAMDMFDITNMVRCDQMPEYMGFSYDKVKALCQKAGVSFFDLKKLCGGYTVAGNELFCPYSVVKALSQNVFNPSSMFPEPGVNEDLSYAFGFASDAVFDTINDILNGKTQFGRLSYFKQDITFFKYYESVFIFMVYFGYLSYDKERLFVPNDAARVQIENAMKTKKRSRKRHSKKYD
ncbi:MAG: AAA family ATPase [Clostridia bacterium]|nr:AAA family ATPase [Clostridia bacterium]